MEVYQLIRKGEMHRDFCEDFLLSFDINEQYSVFGVFDGCSTGIDSHMASALIAKVVKAEMECLALEPISSLRNFLNDAIFNTMSTLRNIRNDLFLETSELLSTIVLLVIDKTFKIGEALVFGDGFLSINGQSVNIEQDNAPDYLAYYLDELDNITDFEAWLAEHSNRYIIDEVKDVSIATDGISSFHVADTSIEANGRPVPSDFLTKNDYLLHNKSMLARKLNILRTKYRLINQDDVAMIRLVAGF
jgi:serine/threonine protein phosphatase PrpC